MRHALSIILHALNSYRSVNKIRFLVERRRGHCKFTITSDKYALIICDHCQKGYSESVVISGIAVHFLLKVQVEVIDSTQVNLSAIRPSILDYYRRITDKFTCIPSTCCNFKRKCSYSERPDNK